MHPFMITRLILVGGLLAASFGLALIVPALVPYLDRGVFSQLAWIVVSLGIVLVVGGAAAIMFARRRPSGIAMPAPVRAAVMAAILFLAFCVLELSDGLLRRNGRIFYWTAVLFLPALAMLYGLLAAQRWAWWISRGTAFLAALWFVAFIFLIPFAELRTDGVPVFVAASVEPSTGDPELVAVAASDEPGVWWIDRRTMRPERVPPAARAPEALIVRAADLADRVHLGLARA